jgi:pyruvate formate lyase activating enzyme
MDAQMHRDETGITNELILANLPRVVGKVKTWIRVPLIPNYNDSESNMVALARLASDLKIEKISLLPYHSWGEQKYGRLGLDYALRETEPPSEEKMQELKQMLEKWGLRVDIGR